MRCAIALASSSAADRGVMANLKSPLSASISSSPWRADAAAIRSRRR